METRFNTYVYEFIVKNLSLIFDKYKGYVVGSEGLTKVIVMKEIFGEFKPNNDIKDNPYPLQCTSESQGHGKAWEIDIATRVYGLSLEIINKYSHISKYDIPEEDNLLHNKNVSIKASGGMCLCMSDIRRMLKSENMDVVCIIWKQISPKIKEAIKTVVFDFDEFKGKLIEDLKKCGYTLEGWLKLIDDYDNYVKCLPKDYYLNSKKLPQKQREHLIKKAYLCKNINYFQVNPKIDSKQQRVQCSINLNKVNINKQIFEGGVLFDKEYTQKIDSTSRIRHKK
jgi:hypothetical protein